MSKGRTTAQGRRRIPLLAAPSLLLLLLSAPLWAGSGSWTNDASGTWVTAANWRNSTVAGSISNAASPDTAYFTNSTAATGIATRTVTVDTGRSLKNIVINPQQATNATNHLTLSGGKLWLAGGGAITHSRTNSDVTDTISSPILLKGDGGTYSFIANGGQYTTFTISGAVTGESTGANVTTLTLDGTSISATPARSQNGVSGVISDGTGGGTLALIKAGAGVWTFQGNSTYSGGTLLNQGTLRFFGNNASDFFGPGRLTIANGTAFSHANTGTNTIRNDLQVNGSFSVAGSANVGFTGNIDLGAANRTITVTVVSNATFSGVVANGGLTKAGAGALTLLGANTYNWGTTVSAGTLIQAAAGAIPDNTALTVNGGALDLNGLGLTVSSLSGTGGSITNAGVALTVNQGGPTTSASVLVGDGSLLKSGGGTLTLSGASTFTGGVTLNGGALAVGGAETAGVSGPLGAAGSISFNGGTLQYSAANAYDYSSRFSAATGQTFSVDTAGQDVTFASNLAGSGNTFTKLGDGTLTLSGANTFTGGVNLNGGTLAVAAVETAGVSGPLGAVGGISFNGGTLQYSAANTYDYSGRFSAAAGQARSVDTGGQNVTLAGNLGGSSNTFAKLGTGTLNLKGANTYSGATTVAGGTLLLNGSLAAASAVTVLSGATLGGTGVISGPVSVGTGGTLQPGPGGTTIATLTNRGSLTLAGNVVFNLNRAAAPNTSKIAGLASVSYGGDLTVKNVGAALQSGDSFKLFDATNRSGTFQYYSLPLAGAGLTWNLNQLASSGTISVVGGSGIAYLDNGVIKVGADLAKGGSITYLSLSGSTDNLINNHDLGRQVQQSYYSGPQLYDPYGNINPNWSNWPWNPIQTGDSYGNRSQTIAYYNNGTTIYVQCRPMQWALNNVPGECTFESWITLSNNSVTVSNRLLNARTDTAEQFIARSQELPAVYSIGRLYRLFSYAGLKPFTGDALSEQPGSPPPWDRWNATESWGALVDLGGWGIGIYHPGSVKFIGGFSGTKGSGGPNDSQTGYMSPLHTEILDSKIEYSYRYHLILGTLTQIRSWVYAQPYRPGCDFEFTSDRQHWSYPNTNNSDWGLPLTNDCLRVKLETADPAMVSPQSAFYASNLSKIYLRAAYHRPGASSGTAQLYWITNDVGGFTGACSVGFPVTVDDQFHTYEVNVAASTNWTGLITKLRFDPIGAGVAGAYMDLLSLSSVLPMETSPTNLSYSLSGGVLALRWPPAYLGWQLQSNSVSLGRTNYWFDVPGSTTVTNVNCNLDSAPTSVFFRLRLP